MPRLSVIFFVTEDWYFCSHRLPLALAAKEAGYDVAVVTRVRAHGSIIEEAGIRLIPFDMNRRSLNVFSELAVIARLTMLYRRERPDLVHHVAIKPVVYGAIAARLAHVKSVVHAVAGLGWLVSSSSRRAALLGRVARLLFKKLLSRGSVIVQNPNDRDWLHNIGVPLPNITLIRGSGVDVRHFMPQLTPDGPPVVVLVARMLWDKGVGEFVNAAGLIHAKGIKARFVLVGAPDLENPASISEKQLYSWHEEGQVEWWGAQDDMASILSQIHIACLPSYYGEGVPKSLLEAAAAGLPIVTTDMPGCREVVNDGQNGVLVPPRDVEALADGLIKLIVNPRACVEMGEKSRELAVAEFSTDSVVLETLGLYETMLS